MSVTECRLHGKLNYALKMRGDHTVSATYYIETNNPLDSGFDVYTGAGGASMKDPLPRLGQNLQLLGDNLPTLFVSDVSLTQPDQLKNTRWEAQVTWTQPDEGENPNDDVTPPLSRPANWHFEFEAITEGVSNAWNIDDIVRADTTKRPANEFGPIVTAALLPFEDRVTEDKFMSVLVIKKNYANGLYAAYLNQTYEKTINDQPMFKDSKFEVEKHCARFDGAHTSEARLEQGQNYYEVVVRIAISREPFYREILNRGNQCWDTEKNDHRSVTTLGADRIPIEASGPMPLAEDGTQLPKTGKVNFIKYRTRESVDYSEFEDLIWP